MFCGHCGTQIPDEAVFCPSCGQKIESSSRENQTPPALQTPVPPIKGHATGEAFLGSLSSVEKMALAGAFIVGGLMAPSAAVAFFSNFEKVTNLMGMYSGIEPAMGVLIYAVFSLSFVFVPLDAFLRVIQRLKPGSMRCEDWKFIAVQFGMIVLVSLVLVGFIGPYADDNTFHSTTTMCIYAFMNSVWPEVSLFVIPSVAMTGICAYLSRTSVNK